MDGCQWKRIVVAFTTLAVAAAGCATSGGSSSESGIGTGVAGSDGVRRDAVGRPVVAEFTTVADLRDIHFDFDRYDIRPEAARTLDANADWLRTNPRHLVLIEGHADERGTTEYNLTLGDRRARASMNYLVSRGVDARRITMISYGEERAICAEKNEACWARNRRAHFAATTR